MGGAVPPGRSLSFDWSVPIRVVAPPRRPQPPRIIHGGGEDCAGKGAGAGGSGSGSGAWLAAEEWKAKEM